MKYLKKQFQIGMLTMFLTLTGAFTAKAAVLTPVASGTVTYSEGGVLLDASNGSKGYVMIQYSGASPKIKVQITKSGQTTYTYDLNARSAYEVFPLSAGSGTYAVKVFEHVQDTKYVQVFSKDVSASLENEFIPFLYPNQYANFTAGSAAVSKGAELVQGVADQTTMVTNIYNYVVQNITYDTAKAGSVKSGYLPNVDTVLAEKKGICFDYAALMCAMLRSQDIPTKLVVGYTREGLYHAWIDVYLENVGWVNSVIYFDGTTWRLMDPTFAASGGGDPEVQKYITDATNYQTKYCY